VTTFFRINVFLVVISANWFHPSQQATAAEAAIAIDFPLDRSIFPPEITPPTFLWRDSNEDATEWRIDVVCAGCPRIRVKAVGERMAKGEIDLRCATPTNAPVLTQEQAVTRIWTPDASIWETIKKHSVAKPAVVTITGLRGNVATSRGRVSISTSRDRVAAPIFYRDVPLMPTEGERGEIRPLPPQAIGLASASWTKPWRSFINASRSIRRAPRPSTISG
jgi:hypothetical protein